MLLNIRDNVQRTPLLGLWLARKQSLKPFVDEYAYAAGIYAGKVLDIDTARYEPGVRVIFQGYYSKGLLPLWSEALKKAAPRTPSPVMAGGLTVTGLINATELFELTVMRNPGGVLSTLVIPELVGVGNQAVFTADVRGIIPGFIHNVYTVMDEYLKLYPKLGRPFFGSAIANTAKCRKCGTVIESRTRHEFVSCPCGAVSIDGGTDYFRRCGDPADFAPMTDLDTVQYIKPNKEDAVYD